MLSMIKKWFWYNWVIIALRTIWLGIIVIADVLHPAMIAIPFGVIILIAFLVYAIPLIVQYRKENWYLAVEVVMTGFFYLFVAYVAPGLIWSFVLLVIIIGVASSRRTYMWTGISSGIIFPALNGLITNRLPYEFMFSCSFGFAIGMAFSILIESHKQARIIQEQKQLLEQHIKQIEELTLIEERNRLSHELHDTIGHSLTSLLVGVESLRSSVPDSQVERVDTLVSIAQRSLDGIRKHLHQLSDARLNQSLSEALLELTEEFMKSTGVTVNFRVIGSETAVMQKMSFCLYRCLQESLTNAVRHGQASVISVDLYFESQQLRLQIEDNGNGLESNEFDLGLKGIKERLEQQQGTLSVHSQSGQGTVVICNVPIQVEAGQGSIRLLIVDDQVMIADSLQQILSQQDNFIVVGTASDGQEALEQCERHQPDIVLMDVHMQGMNGLEAFLQMKERWPNMKIVVMTTFEDSVQAATALEHGAEGYMLKSTRPKEMMEAMKLIYSGGTWLDQSIATRVFEEMKRQREQLEKYSPNDPYGLTKREREILQLLSDGLRYKSIATKLYLSEGTVRNYCSTLYSKLGVSNREEAIELARNESIL
ncbi:two-component system sensor histidine kinase/response regulator [Brevibacillus formosus]|uniref:Two-component system sensor histidine kinase/response regulator n=1 Tax=Brevibacillus formosus TaxID=54913 RepID=A0A220MN06_9BACL|nr:hybrid sensor histidine kinase/response regulator transcription factor [Brevibacillus formosus]ASJ56468.1 two-component system sensor histidine kinase/response regulator [Brevibacillus formosus]